MPVGQPVRNRQGRHSRRGDRQVRGVNQDAAAVAGPLGRVARQAARVFLYPFSSVPRRGTGPPGWRALWRL